MINRAMEYGIIVEISVPVPVSLQYFSVIVRTIPKNGIKGEMILVDESPILYAN